LCASLVADVHILTYALFDNHVQRIELEAKLAQLASQQTALNANVSSVEDEIFAEFGGNLVEIRAFERREAEEGGKVANDSHFLSRKNTFTFGILTYRLEKKHFKLASRHVERCARTIS